MHLCAMLFRHEDVSQDALLRVESASAGLEDGDLVLCQAEHRVAGCHLIGGEDFMRQGMVSDGAQSALNDLVVGLAHHQTPAEVQQRLAVVLLLLLLRLVEDLQLLPQSQRSLQQWDI
eukprot:scaffold869_cov160-Ochromonas_danica.AAC.15